MKCSKCNKDATGMVAIKKAGYAHFVVIYEFRCNEHLEDYHDIA